MYRIYVLTTSFNFNENQVDLLGFVEKNIFLTTFLRPRSKSKVYPQLGDPEEGVYWHKLVEPEKFIKEQHKLLR